MTDIFAEMFRLWEIIKSFLAILSLIGISIVAVVAAAYSFFKYLGAKWIDQKFAEQLEAYKSEQSRELERLRHRINGVFDRTKRLHDREFELLPDIWAKLVDARGWAGGYIAVFQQYEDVARLNEADLHEFLATTSFSEGQKREIKAASDKQKAYIAVLERHRYHEVMGKLMEANASVSKHGIFVLPEIRQDMKKLIDLLHSAVIEHQINQEHDVRPRMREASDKLKREGEPLFTLIEEAVIARLWDSTTASV